MSYAEYGFWLTLALTGGPVLSCWLTLGFALFLSQRHLDEMLAALEKSSEFALSAPILLGQGWFGRVVLLIKVWGALGWPGPRMRAGVLNPKEVTKFPPALKRKLRFLSFLAYLTIIWGGVAYYVLGMGNARAAVHP